jgi:hypothetical protein
MGFLPIILAILGFLFLWAIVNYQSLRIRKNEVDHAADEVFQQAGYRNQILKSLPSSDNDEVGLKEIFALIKRKLDEHQRTEMSVEDKIRHEKQIDELMTDIPPPDGHAEYEESYLALQKSHQDYQRAVVSYRRRLREYNELIQKNPTKMLAKLSGFRPIA